MNESTTREDERVPDDGGSWMNIDEYLAQPVQPSDPLTEIDSIAPEAAEDWPSDDPRAAVAHVLKLTWGDLMGARRAAINGVWSIQCGRLVWRIMGLTRIAGPTPWEEVPVDLLLNGWYQRIHAAIGVEAPLTADDLRRAQEVKDRRGAS